MDALRAYVQRPPAGIVQRLTAPDALASVTAVSEHRPKVEAEFEADFVGKAPFRPLQRCDSCQAHASFCRRSPHVCAGSFTSGCLRLHLSSTPPTKTCRSHSAPNGRLHEALRSRPACLLQKRDPRPSSFALPRSTHPGEHYDARQPPRRAQQANTRRPMVRLLMQETHLGAECSCRRGRPAANAQRSGRPMTTNEGAHARTALCDAALATPSPSLGAL